MRAPESAPPSSVSCGKDLTGTAPWDWNKVDTSLWFSPSEKVYFFLYRWKEKNLLNLLDLGCGIGRHSILFAENGFSVVGLDLSKTGLDKLSDAANSRNLKIGTIQGNIVDLPFNKNQFDSILAHHSIYHVDSPGMMRVIDNIARILKPDGEIFFSMLSKSNRSFTSEECTVIDKNVRLKKEEDGNILPHYYVAHQDIIDLFSGGFDILKICHIEEFSSHKSNWHYFIHAKRNIIDIGQSPPTLPTAQAD